MRIEKPPQLIVFDLYGTLVKFGVMHHPFRKILQWAKQNGRKPQQDDARQLMTINEDSSELFSKLSIFPPDYLLHQFRQEIEEELNALSLFDDVIPTLHALTEKGIPLAICSNLAKPYGAVIDRLLPQFNFIQCLSYEVGAIKPEYEIYDGIVTKSGISAKQILFVGDTLLADYEGPIKYGFKALHLLREGKSEKARIGTLIDIKSLW
jgi:HAD superfamily hydrolase (TIGR01549 family)